MRKRSVWKDTIRMTMVQFVLECLSLLFNAWMTRCIGAAIVGTLALAGSFFNLVSMAAGGNAMLCASRFVSEELGKKNGNSRKILRYAILFCFTLSIPVACGIYCFAQSLGRQFLQSDEIENAVRLMACLLPVGGVSACLKGYFNAMCRVTVTAFCDVAEFFLRSGLLIILLQFHKEDDTEKICTYMVISMAARTIFTGIILTVLYFRERNHTIGKSSISFGQYMKLAIPVAFGGCLISALSTANDTLIPKTLRQFGDNTSQALEQFGIFESIVIPVLFFPSTILCALFSILIPEVARAKVAGDQKRLQQLTELVIEWTLIFAVFIAAMFIRYGNWIGKWMDRGQLSGRMIQILAPVVPFIYLEIVLEALIKGMGRQNFSSLNYLTEYVI
ncbi:MAG: oligosaccharide flippase family protein [Ruminococcus sp.]|nr:oligosaccharide flippase family protein [Ruminococcus sp.]